jgi:hypothetical protein
MVIHEKSPTRGLEAQMSMKSSGSGLHGGQPVLAISGAFFTGFAGSQ